MNLIAVGSVTGGIESGITQDVFCFGGPVNRGISVINVVVEIVYGTASEVISVVVAFQVINVVVIIGAGRASSPVSVVCKLNIRLFGAQIKYIVVDKGIGCPAADFKGKLRL